jgi:protein involved in sex pheromone biosynthesis
MKPSFTAFAATLAAAIVLSACSPIENREDFANQLKNKTEDEVVKFAGKPTNIDRSNPERVAYVYKSRTFDVSTRKTDPETDVIFASSSDGKLHVTEVEFK